MTSIQLRTLNLHQKSFQLRDRSFNVTIPPRPPEYVNFFVPFHFLADDQLVVPIGVSHISS